MGVGSVDDISGSGAAGTKLSTVANLGMRSRKFGDNPWASMLCVIISVVLSTA